MATEPEPTTPVPQGLRFPFELVRPQLEEVEQSIRDQARAFDPAVEGYVSYVCNTAGKRIRPALALLAGGATGGIDGRHRDLGLILELIHIASLVHDDLMDGATVRRDMPTAWAKWGPTLSVLLGDSLFAYALELSCDFADTVFSREIARAAREVCTGEIVQTQRRFDLNLSAGDYFKILEQKTAALFSAATSLAAYLNGRDEVVQRALSSYGGRLGIAYQIYDDCLDLVGDEGEVGKTLGTDLLKGKLTLPILYLIESATEGQRAKLNRLLLLREPVDAATLAGIADYEGAIEKAVGKAKQMLDDARGDLAGLDGNEHGQGLLGLTYFLDHLLDGCRID
jgi:octaprenyl-diphosphate synthase